MNSFRENSLKYGSYFLLFLAPLVFLNHRLFPHVSTKTFFICGVVEVLFFLWIYAIIVDKSYRLSKKVLRVFLPLMGFVAWMTISGVFGANPSLSFWSSLGRGTGLLTLYHCLAFSFVIASLVKKNGMTYVASLFQWFIAGSLVLALSIWTGSEGFNFSAKVFKTDGGGGFTGNSTLAAGYLLFTLATAVFLLCLKSINKSKKWLIVIALVTILFSPVFVSLHSLFTGHGILGSARGTILALVAGIGTTGVGYMYLSKKRALRATSISMVAIAIIAFGFLWVQLLIPNTNLHNKFAQEARGSRFIFWDIAQKAMNEHPILGYGAENYAIAFQEHFDPEILVVENSFEGWSDRAHNIYYELGATAGYPAVILYFIFLVSLFYAIYRLYKQNKLNRMQASIMAGLLVAYVVNNLFTFDSNLSLMSLFMLAGILYALGNQNDPKQKFLPSKIDTSNKNMIACGLVIVFVVSLIFLVRMPSMKSKAYAETFAAPINKRPDMYAKLLSGSHVGEQWDVSDLAFNTHKIYSSDPVGLKADKSKLPYLIKNLESLLDYLYKVSETNGTDYRLYLTIAHLENTLTYLSDRAYDPVVQERILAILQKAIHLSPSNPNAYWSMAQTKIWGGDLKGAEAAYRQAVLVAPTIPSSYNLLLNYAKIVEDKKLFDEVMTQAQENIPGYVFKN